MKNSITKMLAVGALAIFGGVPIMRADDGQEDKQPNCYVFIDNEDVETEFFGNVIVFEHNREDNTHYVVASKDNYQNDLSKYSTDNYFAKWLTSSIKEIKHEYRVDAGIVKPIVPGEKPEVIIGDGGDIRIKGAKPGSVMRVISANGIELACHNLNGDDCCYSFSSLRPGVYVLVIGGTTVKIVKK